MQSDILIQGFMLMAFGMGTVLLFLGALVIATTVMSGALARWFPGPAQAEAATGPGAGDDAGEDKLVAVVTAAVHRYRSRR